MPLCVVKTCKNHSRSVKKRQGITFHRFPSTNDEWKNDWVEIIRKCRYETDWNPTKYSVICSIHFDEKDLYETKCGYLRVVAYAVPKKYLFERLRAGEQFAEPNTSSTSYGLVFNKKPRKGAGSDGQASGSTISELQYQDSRYSIVEVPSDPSKAQDSGVEQIIIKEELSDEEHNQCRLCLSVGRRMRQLGKLANIYRKLLFDINYHEPSVVGCMSELVACWECLGMLRKVQQFQMKVRTANVAFETKQNLNCSNLSNLTAVILDHTDKSTIVPDIVIPVELIKKEVVEMEVDVSVEVEESNDPLEDKSAKEKEETITKPKEVTQTQIDVSSIVNCDAIFVKVKIEFEELQSIVEHRRSKESFRSMAHKCDSCVLGFTDLSKLEEHNSSFHSEDVGSFQCDICQRRFVEQRHLSAHYRNHFVKFVCKLCNFECYTKTGRMIHFKRHKGGLPGFKSLSLVRPKFVPSNSQASTSGASTKVGT